MTATAKEEAMNTTERAAPIRSDTDDLHGYLVDSSNVEYVGWLRDQQAIVVRYLNGGSYLYLGAPRQRAVAAAHAESVGAYINSRLKPRYPFVRIADKLRLAGTQRNALERRCPTCGAQPGEPCERIKAAKGRSHAARWRK